MENAGLLASVLTFFVLAASPGPATLALATVAMGRGRATGLAFAAGLSCGLAFWGVIAATGLGAILERTPAVLIALKLAGAAYLVWLAFLSARAAAAPANTRGAVKRNGSAFLQGVWLNLSNPKAVIAWMAALSVGAADVSGLSWVAVATLSCVICGGVIYGGFALAFSVSGIMAAYSRARRWIDGTAAALFALAGLGLVRSAFSR